MLTDFVQRLQNSTLGRRLVAEEAAAVHKTRSPLAKEHAQLSAQLPELRREHEQLLAPHDEAVLNAQAVLTRVTETRARARRECLAEAAKVANRLAYLEKELRASADPKVADARRAMVERFEHGRHNMGIAEQVITNELNSNGKRVRGVRTNQQAVGRLLEALRAARAALDSLHLQEPDDLDASIAAIVAPVTSAWDRIGELDPA